MSIFIKYGPFTFKPMNLKKSSSEVYKCIHFLKAYCVRILKRKVLNQIYWVGQSYSLYRVKQTKNHENNSKSEQEVLSHLKVAQHSSSLIENSFVSDGSAFDRSDEVTEPGLWGRITHQFIC